MRREIARWPRMGIVEYSSAVDKPVARDASSVCSISNKLQRFEIIVRCQLKRRYSVIMADREEHVSFFFRLLIAANMLLPQATQAVLYNVPTTATISLPDLPFELTGIACYAVWFLALTAWAYTSRMSTPPPTLDELREEGDCVVGAVEDVCQFITCESHPHIRGVSAPSPEWSTYYDTDVTIFKKRRQ